MVYDSQSIPNLRHIRTEFGLSMRRFAREIGVHHRAIWHLEHGGRAHHETVRKLHIGIRRLMREKREREARKRIAV